MAKKKHSARESAQNERARAVYKALADAIKGLSIEEAIAVCEEVETHAKACATSLREENEEAE